MDQNTLYEILECSVCMEVLDGTSRVLPCQHTFCRRCLDEIVATKKFLQCPECRMPVNKRVEDLPPNILLVRLLETMKTMAHQRSSNSRHNAECGRSSNRHATNRNANSTNSKPSYPCAKALYNYEAQEVGDLNFKRGDVVRLRKQIDENWYLGEIGSQQGYFPSTYVEVIVPLPGGVPACKALYDFVIDDENEKDCLTFHKAETIVVLRRVDDNWAEGKLGDRIGIFPLSFVELNESAKCLIGCMDAVNDNSWSASNVAAFGNPLATNRNTYSSSSAFVGPSVAATPVGPPLPMPVASTMQAMKVTQALAHHRPSVGVPSSGVEVNTPVSSAASLRKKPLPLIYEALYNYKPIKEDEIELKKGECYTVLQKCRDGWFKGRSLSTGVFGIFPGNYVKQIVLLPLDDVAFVQQSLSPSTSAGASVSRGMPLGTGKQQAASKSSSHATYYCDASENSSALGRRPRSRPITNITQAQIRNSGNSFVTSVANTSRCHRADGVVSADVGGSCSPTWLNLMTHPRSSASADCATANSTSSGRHKVQRSATCRTRSVSRVPLSVLVSDQTMSDGLDSENLRTMLQGLTLTEPDDPGADGSVNGGCQVTARNAATVGSSSVHSADSDKIDKRSGLMKRWTGGMPKAKRPAQAAAATSAYVAGVDRNALGSPQPSATPERCVNALSKLGGESLVSQSAQKPVKVSLTKVLPVSLASVQSKNVNTEPYKCVMPYPAQNENELELKVGDIVFVTRKHDDGWFKGVLQRTGKVGLFPGSFVQNAGSS